MSMTPQKIKNLVITTVVVAVMALISFANQIHTYQQSALKQWQHVESAFMNHAQLISRLPLLVSESTLAKENPTLINPKETFPTITDHEQQITYISDQKAWIDTFINQPKLKKQLSKRSQFIPVYQTSIQPKLLRETTDYNQQVKYFNDQLAKPLYSFLGKLKGFHPLPYLSIDQVKEVMVISEAAAHLGASNS